MITVDEAYNIVQSTSRGFGDQQISLMDGIGRVLMEDWHCDRDLPPYDRVTMDGIAFKYDDVKGKTVLPISGVVAAGDPQSELCATGTCLEVMTGAVLPVGADTVIRYEDLTIAAGEAIINAHYTQGQNIHTRGQDRSQGDLLVPSGTLLSPSEIGVGASIGRADIAVAQYPKTIIISTGNELVEVDEIPAPHQIRRGNVYRIQSTLKHLGIHAETDHIVDDQEVTEEKLKQYLRGYELIILSGGVSKGKFDFLPGALAACGVEKLFHKIAQRPGKPMWFGRHPEGATVFALPGNPVSSFMCLQIYVLDWIRTCIGLEVETRPMARLTEAISFKPSLTYFLEVATSYTNQGQLLATPKKGNGSGDLANLLYGNAFIRLPMDQVEFEAGGVYPIYHYR